MKILLHEYEDVAAMTANNVIFITYSFRKKDNGSYTLEVIISTKCDDNSVAVCGIRVFDDVDRNDARAIEETKDHVKELTEIFKANGFKVISGTITTDPTYRLAVPLKSLQENGSFKKLEAIAVDVHIELKESDIHVSEGTEPDSLTMEFTDGAKERIIAELQEKMVETEKKTRKKT